MKIPPPGILRGKDSTTAGGDKWPGPQLLFTPNELLNILAWFTPSQSFLGGGGGLNHSKGGGRRGLTNIHSFSLSSMLCPVPRSVCLFLTCVIPCPRLLYPFCPLLSGTLSSSTVSCVLNRLSYFWNRRRPPVWRTMVLYQTWRYAPFSQWPTNRIL